MHHGLWDYDNPAAPNLLDVTVDGRRVKAVAQITKQGFVYTFDRVTGAPIWPIEERPVPASDVPGERASPTQPFPTRPAPFEYQGVSHRRPRRLHAGHSRAGRGGDQELPHRPALHAAVAAGHDRAAGVGRRRQLGRRRRRSRDRHALRAVAQRLQRDARWPRPIRSWRATCSSCRCRGRSPRMPDGVPLFKPPYSRITAIDMNTRRAPLDGAGRRGRAHPRVCRRCTGLDLPPLGGDSTFSGPLLTKTALFYALTTGGTDGGPRLVALRQGHRARTRIRRSARRRDRHADDLSDRRTPVHRAHRAGRRRATPCLSWWRWRCLRRAGTGARGSGAGVSATRGPGPRRRTAQIRESQRDRCFQRRPLAPSPEPRVPVRSPHADEKKRLTEMVSCAG